MESYHTIHRKKALSTCRCAVQGVHVSHIKPRLLSCANTFPCAPLKSLLVTQSRCAQLQYTPKIPPPLNFFFSMMRHLRQIPGVGSIRRSIWRSTLAPRMWGPSHAPCYGLNGKIEGSIRFSGNLSSVTKVTLTVSRRHICEMHPTFLILLVA